jgi:hypothetical protein
MCIQYGYKFNKQVKQNNKYIKGNKMGKTFKTLTNEINKGYIEKDAIEVLIKENVNSIISRSINMINTDDTVKSLSNKPRKMKQLVKSRIITETDSLNKKTKDMINKAIEISFTLIFKDLHMLEYNHLLEFSVSKILEILKHCTNNEMTEIINNKLELKEINTILKSKKTRVQTKQVFLYPKAK